MALADFREQGLLGNAEALGDNEDTNSVTYRFRIPGKKIHGPSGFLSGSMRTLLHEKKLVRLNARAHPPSELRA